jgi:hypothetical protein
MKGLSTLVYAIITSSRPLTTDQIQIVKKCSALLETNHKEQIPVDADHAAMCKFETVRDDTFETIYKRVK